MNDQFLIYPMAAMVAITFFVVFNLFRTRVLSVKNGSVQPSYFKTYQGENTEADKALQLSRHFINCFETPVLFYVVCLAVMITGLTNSVFVGLAWAYVSLRAAHAFIHTGSNKLKPRIGIYFSSLIVLMGLWIYLIVRISL